MPPPTENPDYMPLRCLYPHSSLQPGAGCTSSAPGKFILPEQMSGLVLEGWSIHTHSWAGRLGLVPGTRRSSPMSGWEMFLHLAQDEVSRHGVGGPATSFKTGMSSWLLLSHVRMRFEKWEGCTMGKMDFDHSNLLFNFR